MINKRELQRIHIRQLLDRYGVHRIDGSQKRRDLLVEEILKIADRFNADPSLDEALNSGDGSYKP